MYFFFMYIHLRFLGAFCGYSLLISSIEAERYICFRVIVPDNLIPTTFISANSTNGASRGYFNYSFHFSKNFRATPDCESSTMLK